MHIAKCITSKNFVFIKCPYRSKEVLNMKMDVGIKKDHQKALKKILLSPPSSTNLDRIIKSLPDSNSAIISLNRGANSLIFVSTQPI